LKITAQEVRSVADLANLELTGEELARMTRELDAILTHVEKLNELDTSAVEPMAQAICEAAGTETLREDEPGLPLGAEAALASAPASGAGHFKVPKVIER